MLAARLFRTIAISWLLLSLFGGCTSFFRAVPARCTSVPRLPQTPRADQQPINYLRLRQDPPPFYVLAPGDVVGIYIETVLGTTEGVPPVYFSEKSNLKPAMGYPVPVRDDGTISLPWVAPIKAEGLTLTQLEDLIRRAYTVDRQILPPTRDRIIVTLMRPRTYNVVVVRGDTEGSNVSSAGLTMGSTKRGKTYAMELPAGENDLMHALSASGGLPGTDAKNEVTILRGTFADATTRDQYLAQLQKGTSADALVSDNNNVVKIPLFYEPGTTPAIFNQEDIILKTGDLVVITTRESEVFYTGGLLGGGQHPIPRDYDLDILGAVAIAGGNIASSPAGNGRGSGGGGGGMGWITFPPSRAVIVRRTPDGQQYSIRCNLKKALVDQNERILIEPNDFVMVEYTAFEMALNIMIQQVRFDYFLNGMGNGNGNTNIPPPVATVGGVQ